MNLLRRKKKEIEDKIEKLEKVFQGLEDKIAKSNFEHDKKRFSNEKQEWVEIKQQKINILKNQIIATQQMGDYEHEFHQNKEDKRSELAKLDGEITAKKELLEIKDEQLKQNEKLIQQLLEVLKCNKREIV